MFISFETKNEVGREYECMPCAKMDSHDFSLLLAGVVNLHKK